MSDHLLDLIKSKLPEILLNAGEIALAHKKQGLTQTSKGSLDFLTDADLAVDEFLSKEIKKIIPEVTLLTEETAKENYQSLGDSELLCIIDPIDGTTNFARNFSNWAISVGFVEKGNTKAGFVYKPEENKLYKAFIDEDSAYLNDMRIGVSKTDNLSSSLVIVGWSWDLDKRKKMYETMGKFNLKVRAITDRGSAASDMCLVAQGDADIYVTYGVKPWDIAASNLILTKAGGKITKQDSSSWNVFDPDFITSNSTIIHDNLIELLNS